MLSEGILHSGKTAAVSHSDRPHRHKTTEASENGSLRSINAGNKPSVTDRHFVALAVNRKLILLLLCREHRFRRKHGVLIGRLRCDL